MDLNIFKSSLTFLYLVLFFSRLLMQHFTHQAQFLQYDTITHCYKYSVFLPKLLMFSFILFLYPVDIVKQNALCTS